MNPWSTYEARGDLHGRTSRDRAKYNLMNRLTYQIPSTLSYHNVDIDGEERNIVIINSDNLNQKTLCSLPGEDIRHGAMIDWNSYRWLVTERDANTEIYTKCIMEQCNYLLRWVDPDTKEVKEYWCIIEDGTKLKRMRVRNSLAYWKRYVKTTPLIAGNPLEPYYQNGVANSLKRQRLKTIRIGKSAAKSRTEIRSSTILVAGVEASASKRGALNRFAAW